MSADRVVTVQIYNQAYHLSSDEQDQAEIQRAAAYLDTKMRTAASQAGNRSSLDLAILAALDVAEELVEQRRRKESMLNEVDRRIDRFARRLEAERSPTEQPPDS